MRSSRPRCPCRRFEVKDLSVGEIIGAGGDVTVTVSIASVKRPQPSVTRSVKLAVVAAQAATTSAKTWPLALGAVGLSVTVTPLTVALVPPLTVTLSVLGRLEHHRP